VDLGPWIQAILASGNTPLVAAFLIGLLASLGPCPLTTNIAALGYMSKDLKSPYRVLLTSGLYTLGRTLAYGGLGLAVLAAGVRISRISNSLQTVAEVGLGPLLILVGLVLLDLVHPTFSVGGQWKEHLSKRLADGHSVGAFLLGALFALAFCPYSAALYFGVLIPLAFKSTGGIAFPLLFGIGTSAPVLVIGVPLALGIMRFAAGLELLARVECGMRKVAALIFLGAGALMLWNWIAATWL
jgi:cytochrome c-type biogenesis protein